MSDSTIKEVFKELQTLEEKMTELGYHIDKYILQLLSRLTKQVHRLFPIKEEFRLILWGGICPRGAKHCMLTAFELVLSVIAMVRGRSGFPLDLNSKKYYQYWWICPHKSGHKNFWCKIGIRDLVTTNFSSLCPGTMLGRWNLWELLRQRQWRMACIDIELQFSLVRDIREKAGRKNI